jgi:hypothetical protein
MESGFSSDNNEKHLSYREIEPTEKFGAGKLYKVGVVEVEVYENLPGDKPPLVRIRAPSILMNLSYVSDIRPDNDGGMLIDFSKKGEKVHASLSINRTGELMVIYSPPPSSMGISGSGVRRKVGAIQYEQSIIDIPGTPEGVRVEVRGTVDAMPRLVNPDIRTGPLMFFLYEEHPKDPGKPDPIEIWAVKTGTKQELRRAKLVKGSIVELILYKHTYNETTIGGENITSTRHHLGKILSVTKPSPKGQ